MISQEEKIIIIIIIMDSFTKIERRNINDNKEENVVRKERITCDKKKRKKERSL